MFKKGKKSIETIFFLLNDCKKYGTLPFAGIARCAFVATKILRSLVKLKIFDQSDYDLFFESIYNVQKKINNTLYKDKNLFLKKYGHIRPMTYSISAKNYRERFSDYFDKKNISLKSVKKFKITKNKVKKINQLFKKNNIKCDSKKFFNFAKNAIFYREYSKLIFSKSIDLIFEELIKLGKEVGIKRNEFENISIKDILNYYNNLNVYKLKKILKTEITKNKKQYQITKNLEIPDFISSKNDFYEFKKNSAKANFVTTKDITGKIFNIQKLENLKKKDLEGKIIMLESADPGYDFIFSFKIKGLITKYGGANSHMSIRCIDEGIPAAIGVGDIVYKKLLYAKVININSKQKTINIIS